MGALVASGIKLLRYCVLVNGYRDTITQLRIHIALGVCAAEALLLRTRHNARSRYADFCRADS